MECSVTQLASNVWTAVNRLYQCQTSKSPTRRQSIARCRLATQRDWLIYFQGLRKSPDAFEVSFFLCEPPTAAKDWATASNLVVSQVVLPDNSISKVTPPAMAQIPLSRSLEVAYQSGKLHGNDTKSIKAYLKTNLKWRAMSLNRNACDVATFEGLDVPVVDQQVVMNKREDRCHGYGKFNLHPDLTWQWNTVVV